MKKEIIASDLEKRDQSGRTVAGQFIPPILPAKRDVNGDAARYALDVMHRRFHTHVTVHVYNVASAIEDAWRAGRDSMMAKP